MNVLVVFASIVITQPRIWRTGRGTGDNIGTTPDYGIQQVTDSGGGARLSRQYNIDNTIVGNLLRYYFCTRARITRQKIKI